MKEYKNTSAIDAGLVGAAKAVEHYEIVRYDGLCNWAKELGLTDAARLLDATLREETKTDATLTTLAQEAMHLEAA
jgi:ferritin-like metal-binding protein YciE